MFGVGIAVILFDVISIILVFTFTSTKKAMQETVKLVGSALPGRRSSTAKDRITSSK